MIHVARASVALLVLALGCGGEPAPASHAEPPSHVEHPVREGDLAVVHLSAEARARIGLETSVVADGAPPRSRVVGGEVVVPPGHAIAVAAPVGGVVRPASASSALSPGSAVRRGEALFRLSPLAPVDRDVRARAGREVAAARASLDAAELRLRRQQGLAEERAGSARALEEATAARDVAAADLRMAEAREATLRRAPLLSDVTMTVRAPEDGIVRALSVADGQAVAQGAPLVEIVATDALQIRVPVYAGDIGRVDAAAPAIVRRLGARDDAPALSATPRVGPPTAEPDRITVDRYYAASRDAHLVPGERVLVTLPLVGEERARTVPAAAIVLDASGSAWVYTCEGEGAFRRARVDPIRRAGDLVLFERGPASGTCVVSVGAAEVFGAEFEPGH